VVTGVAMVVAQGPAILPNVALVMMDGATNFPLIAIPPFILAGAIMNSSSISRRLIAFASALLGFVRGGLAMVNIATSMFFAEISGSAVADVAALGSILIPAMKRKGYPVAFATALTSSSATLAVIILPSIPMILYVVMAQSSVVQLFVAGVIPGGLVGIDPVHFGIVVTLNLGIGQKTPPVASVPVTACSVSKADIWEVSKVNIHFIAVLFAVLLLVTYVPAVPMVLVEFCYR